MAVEFDILEPMVVASMRHVGPHTHEATSATWEQLILWASPKRLLGRVPEIRGVGLLWDDPRQWPDALRRYDVGVPIDAADSSSVESPAFLTLTMPGQYAHVRHVGSYEGITAAMQHALDIELPVSGWELVAAPIIELYRNSPAEVAESELVTDIFLPVVRL